MTISAVSYGLTNKHYTITATSQITETFFLKCSSASNGGAISASGSITLTIELCRFYYCSTSGAFGGGFFISNGNLTVSKTCGLDCFLTGSHSRDCGLFFEAYSVSSSEINLVI